MLASKLVLIGKKNEFELILFRLIQVNRKLDSNCSELYHVSSRTRFIVSSIWWRMHILFCLQTKPIKSIGASTCSWFILIRIFFLLVYSLPYCLLEMEIIRKMRVIATSTIDTLEACLNMNWYYGNNIFL